jgi:Cu(I)/Ag(I) efflux system membrane protein CusA/SilA
VERNRGDAIRENADKVIKAVKLKMKEVEKDCQKAFPSKLPMISELIEKAIESVKEPY